MKTRIQTTFASFWLMACGMQCLSAQTSDFKVAVDLVTVEVAAVDKNGKPVSGLTKEDFQIYEDGRKQEIASVDEVKAVTGESSLEKRPIIVDERHLGKIVLILFNDTLITPDNIKKSREAASKFVQEHMGPHDMFGVALFSASMKILQNLTTDKDRVLAAIAQPAGSNPAGLMYSDLYGSLEQINKSLARLKGKKNVLIFSQSRYFNPNNNNPNVLGYGMQFSRPGSRRKNMDSARRANVVYYTVDVAGIGTADADPKWRTDYLDSLTRDGGHAIFNTNNIGAELDKLNLQLSNYYILGFQSTNAKHDGAFRKLEIKMNVKGLTPKYLPGYQDRSPVDVLSSSRQEQRLLSALASPGASTQLPIAFRPFYFFDSPKSVRTFLFAQIQTTKITLKKKSGQLIADLNVMGVAYGEDGGIAARFSEPLPISIDADDEAEFRKGTLPYRNFLKLRPGKYLLKIAVSDNSENMGSAEQPVEIPSLPDKAIGLSSLVLAKRAAPLPELIQNLQMQMLDESDPLVFSGMQISPDVENKLKAKATAVIFFRIYNLPSNLNSLDLVVIPSLLDRKGTQLVLDQIPLRKNIITLGNSIAAVAFNLPLAIASVGKYRLICEIADSAGAKLANAVTDLEVVP